jgi:3-dehydroquinate dehydratase-2
VEVHLSNIEEREDFRRISVTKDVCIAQVHGHGWKSYLVGLDRLLDHLG